MNESRPWEDGLPQGGEVSIQTLNTRLHCSLLKAFWLLPPRLPSGGQVSEPLMVRDG